MRRFLIPAVAAAVLALADPAPAGAQIIVRGPTYIVPDPMPPRALPRVLLPGESSAIPFASGSPVELALNRALWGWATRGYGPYSAYYAPVPATRVVGVPVQVVPAQWVQPWSGNNGWFKGGAKGAMKGGGKGKGKG